MVTVSLLIVGACLVHPSRCPFPFQQWLTVLCQEAFLGIAQCIIHGSALQEYLKASGVPYTALRTSIFFDNFITFFQYQSMCASLQLQAPFSYCNAAHAAAELTRHCGLNSEGSRAEESILAPLFSACAQGRRKGVVRQPGHRPARRARRGRHWRHCCRSVSTIASYL